MRIFSLLLAFSFLIFTGCDKESSLEVKIKDVEWKEEKNPYNNSTVYKTIITIADDRKLTFEGIHDFKIGNFYKIKVREKNAALVKFEHSSKEETPQTFKPSTTTSDKIVFKVVVDKSGNILASEEIGPEVKTAKVESTKK